jgi:hypothetical protein
MNLRQRGIYCLPNGRELVVLGKLENNHNQFRLGGWGQFEFTEYVINEVGRLLAQGRLTAWDINDLIDTGRTANEPG